MPPGHPARPYAELKEKAPDEWAAGDNTGMNIYPKDNVIAGDWAFSRGEYDISFIQDDKEVTLDGKFLTHPEATAGRVVQDLPRLLQA